MKFKSISMKTNTENSIYRNVFLTSFAAAAELKDSEADEQWAGFSRQLSDKERDEIERGGSRAGAREGAAFLALYPVSERDETL